MLHQQIALTILTLLMLGCGTSYSPQPPKCRAAGQECGVSNDCCNPALCISYKCQNPGAQSADEVSISYTSSYGTSTSSIEVMGMFEPPSGQWEKNLCPPTYSSSSAGCSIKVPTNASGILLNARIIYNGNEHWACDENPCGSSFSQNGVYSVTYRGQRVVPLLIPNGIGCGCNLRYQL